MESLDRALGKAETGADILAVVADRDLLVEMAAREDVCLEVSFSRMI